MTNMERLQAFSANMNKLIEKSGKQQKEVAKDLDIPSQTLNNWCKEKSMPRWGMLQKIADYFKVPVDMLVYPPKEQTIQLQIETESKKMDEWQLKRLLAYAKYLNTNPEDN